eukprot:2319036-Pyramimonas_sp.AAC.1
MLPVATAHNLIAKLYSVSQARDCGDTSISDKERTGRHLASSKFGVARFSIYFTSGTAKDRVWEVRKEWSTAWNEKNP